MMSDEVPLPTAIWSSQAPAAPWCPAEWMEHLRTLAPAFVAPEAVQDDDETSSETVAADGWQLVGISRRGRLHAHRAEHREDATAMRLLDGGGWCAAVADGAGSAEHSRIGAALAVFTATHSCAEVFAHLPPTGAPLDGLLHALAAATHEALTRFAEMAGIPRRALRTTLLLAVCRDDEVGFAHVGDGGIVLLHADGAASIPTAGHAGEFSGEVAHFLPDDGAVEAMMASVTVRPARDIAGVLLVSDGIEDPWYPMTRSAPLLFGQLVHGVSDTNCDAGGVRQAMRGPVLGASSPSHALATWIAFEKRGENDDRTLFVARQHGVAWPSSP